MASIEPAPLDNLAARSRFAADSSPADQVRAAARGGAGWVARADAEGGFIALARGAGRADWLAEEFLAAVAAAVAGKGTANPVPAASGPPAVVHDIISLLKAAHRELLKDAVPDQGLEAFVAIADAGRVHLVAAGGVACLRRRNEELEILAPVNQRPRPPLGGSPRALIEVTSETLKRGDLLVAIPGGYELATHPGRAQEARDAVARCAAWARSNAAFLDDQISPAPCVAMAVRGADAPARALAAAQPLARAAGSLANTADPHAHAADPHARVEIKKELAEDPVAAPPEATAPAGGIELPPWLMTPSFPAGEAQPAGEARVGAGVAPESGSSAQGRRSLSRISARAARNVGLTLAALGVIGLLAVGGRMVLDRREAEAPSPLAQVKAEAAHPAGGSGALTALTADAGAANPVTAAAPARGSLSAVTEPFMEGIQVFVDEQPVGPAPAAIDGVAPGRHRVRFSGPQGFAWEEELLVRAGETSQAVARAGDVEDVTLVTVQTTAMSERGLVEKGGWTVLVDGIEEGETPLDLELDPGIHAVTIRRASAPPIHRVLDVRRGDRLILDVNLEEIPAISLEHTPPAHWKAGDSPVLTVVRGGRDARAAEPVHLHVAVDERWQDLVMAPIPGAPGTHAVGVPLPVVIGKTIRYYFSTRSDAGDEVFSAIYSARLR